MGERRLRQLGLDKTVCDGWIEAKNSGRGEEEEEEQEVGPSFVAERQKSSLCVGLGDPTETLLAVAPLEDLTNYLGLKIPPSPHPRIIQCSNSGHCSCFCIMCLTPTSVCLGFPFCIHFVFWSVNSTLFSPGSAPAPRIIHPYWFPPFSLPELTLQDAHLVALNESVLGLSVVLHLWHQGVGKSINLTLMMKV